MAYTISTAFAIYFVLWWVMLFLTLPFGVRSQHEDGEGVARHRSRRADHGADGPQADLDHADLGGHFRGGDVGLPGRISQYRAAVEADGDAVLTS